MNVTLRAITASVCAHYGLSAVDMVSARRSRDIVRPRQLIMWLGARLTRLSLPVIGRHLGGRDHTTVLHGVRTITSLIDADPVLREDAETIAAALGAVIEAGALAPGLATESDPLEVAMQIVTRPSVACSASAADIEAMARCLVGYGRALGAVRFEGDDEPDPELLPIDPEAAAGVPVATARVIGAVRTAWIDYETARFSRGETPAREKLSKALRTLFEHTKEA